MFTTTELYIVLVFLRKKAPFLKETCLCLHFYSVFFGVITLIRTLKNVGKTLKNGLFSYKSLEIALNFE